MKQVRFSYPNNGYASDRALAEAYLFEGGHYTVTHEEINAWLTLYTLEEHPSLTFNSVLFEDL